MDPLELPPLHALAVARQRTRGPAGAAASNCIRFTRKDTPSTRQRTSRRAGGRRRESP